jgi:hypothetical protein
MAFLKKLFGGDQSIQARADAIAAEEASRRARDRSRESDDAFASPFDGEQKVAAFELRPDAAVPDQSAVPGGFGGLAGLFSALKSGELFYGQLDRLAAELTPDQRLAATTNGLSTLPPETVAEVAGRLGTDPSVGSIAQEVAAGLGVDGGVERLARRLAPGAIAPDGSFSFFTAVKDPVVQDGLKALFPAFAEARNTAAI